jgi:ATP/maltotriose-dependent transcriptional regulator MalT
VTIREDLQLLHRERVDAQLEQLFELSGGEVSGPAGSGKTSAVRSWTSRTRLADVVWLSIQQRHRDSKILTADLFDALLPADRQDVRPDDADAAGSMSLLAGSVEHAGRRVVLVIDDVHDLDDAPSLDVVRNLRSADGEALRVLLVGRWIPSAGLDEQRRRGLLATCSAADLRLSPRENAEIVRAAAGREVSDQDVDAVHQQTDGWALGAAVSGLLLRNSPLSMSSADVTHDGYGHFDEVMGDQVFDSIEPDIQQFLLDTCVLEAIDPALCCELTGRIDCEDVLRHLTRSNMFTEWIGGQRLTFQYHRVFRSWLRRRLERVAPGRSVELQRRAAHWCRANERHGEAIEYLLSAGDDPAAGEAIVEFGPRALGEGRYEALTGWIDRLPPDTVASSAALLILLAESAHRSGQTQLMTVVRALASNLLKSEPAELRALNLHLAVEVQRCRELHLAGRPADAAELAFEAISSLDLDSLRPDSNSRPTFGEIALAHDISSFIQVLLVAGETESCITLSQWVVDAFPADDPNVAPVRIACLGRIAMCEVLGRARPAALQHAREAVAMSEYHGSNSADIGWALAVLLVIDSTVDHADVYRRVEQIVETIGFPSLICVARLFRAWSHVQSGDIDTARSMLSGVEPIVESMAQPGMLHALERRVATMVEMGADEPLLGPRERNVLAALAAGASRREAAEQMHLSVNTVKTYVQQAYRALGVGTLHAAVARCGELGISLDPAER